MTNRQRTLETLLFGNPDRIPLQVGSGRESTRARWYREELPETVKPHDIPEYAYRQAGGTLPWPKPGPTFQVNERMIPQFEEKIIEERENSRVVQDWKGNVCEIGKEYTVEYLRNAIDFVTRRWIKCPVENRNDWESIKQRYSADATERLPDKPAQLAQRLADRPNYLELHFSGPFWQLREWLGFEALCTMFYDDPELVRDMIGFWQTHVLRLMQRTFEYVIPDGFHISEDMAYKKFSMISPDMVREFLLPTYTAWAECARNAGIKVRAVDSDGFIGELIPIWIEAGFNACDPVEVAAGNDIIAFREQFGHAMAYRGGVDKRAMAAGGDTLKAEIDRIAPVVRDGGYIPSCDHGVPADVSWSNYIETTRLLAQLAGWL